MGVTLVSTNAVHFSTRKVLCQTIILSIRTIHTTRQLFEARTYVSDNIIRYIFLSTTPAKLT